MGKNSTNLEFFICNENTQDITKGFWKCGLHIAVHTAWDAWALAQSDPSPKAHVIADSARLAANPQSQVWFTLIKISWKKIFITSVISIAD